MKRMHLTDQKMSLFLFLFIWFMYVLIYMTKNCFSAAMAALVSEGIMTKSQTGLINACFYLTYAPFQVIGGKLADRYRPDKLILIGIIGAALSNLLIYINQNFILMMIVWGFNGAIQFGIWPAVFKITSSQLERSMRSRSVFFLSFASSTGLALASAIASLVKDWRDNFLISVIFLVILAIALPLVYSAARKKMVPDTSDDPSATKLIEGAESITSSKLFWVSGVFIFTIPHFIRSILGLGVKAFAPTMLVESYPTLSASVSNSLNILIIACGILGVFAARLLYPRFIKNVMNAHLLMICLLLPITFLVSYVGKFNVTVIMILLCLTDFVSCAMGVFVNFFSMKFAKFGKNGEVSGLLNAFSSLAIVSHSYGLMRIADAFDWKTVFLIMAAAVALAVLVHLIVNRFWKKFLRETEN